MEKKNVSRFVLLPDGTKKEIIKDKGKYYICNDCQFLKSKYPVVKEEKEKKETAKENAD